jgi:hypothetical protein
MHYNIGVEDRPQTLVKEFINAFEFYLNFLYYFQHD